MRAFGLLFAGVLALSPRAGCRAEDEKDAQPPVVEIAGCAWIDGRTCEVAGDRSLHLWIGPSGFAAVRLRAGGAVVTPTATSAVQGGALWSVTVPPGARALDLESDDPRAVPLLHLPIAFAEVSPAVEEARRLRADGDRDGALRLLAGAADMTGDERASAYALRARLRLQGGEIDAAVADFKDAIALRDPSRAAQRVVDEVTLAFALNQRSQRFAEASAVLDEASARTGGDPQGVALVAYHRAIVAYEIGDMRAALSGLDEAGARAARLGDSALVRQAAGVRALALLALGRRREAIARIAELRSESGEIVDCLGVNLAIDASWAWGSCGEDDANEACGVSADHALGEASRAVEEAIAAYPARCADPLMTANALVNAALLRLQSGDVPGARGFLERARTVAPEPGAAVELFASDLENRALLATGFARRALAGFERERARADELLSAAMRWRAETGSAEARERLGDEGGALRAYERAEETAAAESLAVPLGEGRGAFLAERERAAVRHVELLLRAGRDEEALAVLRRTRGGVLAPLERARSFSRLDPDARVRWSAAIGAYRQGRAALEAEAVDDWTLTKDELRRAREGRKAREGELRALLDRTLSDAALARSPSDVALRSPAPGETMLAYLRAADGRWIGFAKTASSLTVKRLPRIDPGAAGEALSLSLLEPFAAEIEAAIRITVLATGGLGAIDFHALPWRGAPLVARAPVAYGLDLPPAPETVGGGARALVVGDPSDDLLAARAEATLVGRALGRDGWSVETKIGRDAQGDGLRAALERADLLHYAGHGVFGAQDGWESALPLADGAGLSVSDLLSLAAVPRLVVLAGCETGKSGDARSGAGLGLAQALLVAGASQVVASTRGVDDATSARVMEGLYAGEVGADGLDLVARLAEAQRALARSSDTVRWQDLRVFVR